MQYPKFMAVSKITYVPYNGPLRSQKGRKKTYHVRIQFDPSCSGFMSTHNYKDMSAAVQAAKRRQKKFGGTTE